MRLPELQKNQGIKSFVGTVIYVILRILAGNPEKGY